MFMLKRFLSRVFSPINNDEGQGMVEYALLVGLIAVVVIAVLLLLGPAIRDKFQAIVTAITGA